MTDVNYDQLAGRYDERYRQGRYDGISTSLDELRDRLGPRAVLEAGCGTGHWFDRWEGAVIVGLDRSFGMLSRADRTAFRVQADAGRMPFATRQFDLVYAVHAVHHFADPAGFVRGAATVLRPGGTLAIFTLDQRALRHRWYLYEYFPGTWETDLLRFQPLPEIEAWMREAGLSGVETRLAERVTFSRRGRDVFNDPFLKKDSNSQLALLSDQAYRQGLRNIEAACDAAEAADREIVFAVDLTVCRITGVAR
ncbi:MAG: class I SAM-dependent methyltransferase [Bryobacteraceae bacterium]